MKRRLYFSLSLLSLILLLLGLPLLGRPVTAETRAGLSLERSVISIGGVIFAESGTFNLGSTIGQTQAGVVSSGGFWANIGFWFESFVDALLNTYLPLVLK